MMVRDTKKITKNAAVLYVQLLLSMIIGLYTSRIVLQVLGIEDFGIYNVIGGVVAMFGILNTAMASSSGRFITFELGGGTTERLRTIFGTSLLIHLSLAVVVGFLVSFVGLHFIREHMSIPAVRLDAAIWVFYCAIFGATMSIVNVPYTAIIVAHERMHVLAYLSTLEMTLKLMAVYSLQYFGTDKLEMYAVLLLVCQVVVQVIYFLYCWFSFNEVRAGICWNRNLLKQMTSFAGWSMFGDAAVLLFTQGVNILLNIFFGAAVNAARGIAVQVQGLVAKFVGGFQTAINPQITKSYANHDLDYMHRLIVMSSKYSFFILLLLSLPIVLEAEQLLTWWLTILPPHTVNFIRVILLISLVDCLANPLIFAAKATGKIKMYQFVLGSLLLLVVPISYMALKMGMPPESVFIVHLGITVLGQGVRVALISPMIKLSIGKYVQTVVTKCMLVAITGAFLPVIVYHILPNSTARLFAVTFVSFISVCAAVYTLSMDSNEKKMVGQMIRDRSRLSQIFRKN